MVAAVGEALTASITSTYRGSYLAVSCALCVFHEGMKVKSCLYTILTYVWHV